MSRHYLYFVFKNSLVKAKMHKPITVLMTTIFVVFIWALWVSNSGSNRRFGRSAYKNPGGVIYDIEGDSYGFNIKGFEYYRKCPVRRKAALKASDIWLLTYKVGKGSIAFKDIQKKHMKPKDVIVKIRYHINWEGTAKLSVNGLDFKTKELVTEQMSQYGDSYCTKIVFLGPVHQVAIVASASVNEAYVIIDELKIGVGTDEFDDMEEEQCG